MSSRKRRYSVAALLFLLLLLLTWLLWPDPRLAKAAELQKQLFGPEAKKLSDQERRQRFQEYRDLTKGMSSSQRRQLSSARSREKQREIASYFGMSQADKTRYLDNQIRRDQSRQGRGQAGGQGKAKGGSGAPARGSSSPQDRDKRRQGFLDGSSPAERAMMSRFRQDLNARRAQLGLAGGRPR
jgi:hypothetical protein